MNREDIKQTMLLAMSEPHSGNAAEAQRIVDAILAAIEAAGVRLVNFAALAEDDAAVEKMARALCVDDDVDPDAVGYDRTGRDLPNWYVVQGTARAALRALGE